MHSRSIAIFIPAYNAAATVGSVVDRIPETLLERIRRIYLINDGSHDKTREVLHAIAAENSHCIVVDQPVNRGYGPTVKHGLALCRDDGAEFTVCLHADGQYPPESIGEFSAVMEEKNIDLMQGSRIASGTALSGGMPLYKYIAGRLLTVCENRMFGLSMTDYHSGFIVYRKKVLQGIRFEQLSNSFDFDLEMIASCRAAGLTVGELPIPTRYADEKSYLNPLTYGLRVLRVMARYRRGVYRAMLSKGET